MKRRNLLTETTGLAAALELPVAFELHPYIDCCGLLWAFMDSDT